MGRGRVFSLKGKAFRFGVVVRTKIKLTQGDVLEPAQAQAQQGLPQGRNVGGVEARRAVQRFPEGHFCRRSNAGFRVAERVGGSRSQPFRLCAQFVRLARRQGEDVAERIQPARAMKQKQGHAVASPFRCPRRFLVGETLPRLQNTAVFAVHAARSGRICRQAGEAMQAALLESGSVRGRFRLLRLHNRRRFRTGGRRVQLCFRGVQQFGFAECAQGVGVEGGGFLFGGRFFGSHRTNHDEGEQQGQQKRKQTGPLNQTLKPGGLDRNRRWLCSQRRAERR